MQITKSERPHIAFFGCTNAGKSSLVNSIVNQNLSLVSEIKGTTTDPVIKSMEILPLGPVVIIDTAGIDDNGKLGELRVKKTKQILDKVDIAILVIDSTIGITEFDKNIKYCKLRILVMNHFFFTQSRISLSCNFVKVSSP